MLTESFVAATQAVNKPSGHLSSALKDIGIFNYEFQPQSIFRSGYKKSSIKAGCLAVSDSQIFAAQADKAVIHVYNRGKGNQEASVAFPDKIYSLAYAQEAAILIIGTEDGKLILWEVATGRISTSSASHLEAITSLVVTRNNEHIISGSTETSIHVWSLPQLVSFPSTSRSYQNATADNVPLRTFSQHRGGTTALAVGHSHTSTNFAVSAGADRTCYLWHIETCLLLRRILTASIPTSIALDPADRAIFLGHGDGTVQNVDLFGRSKQSIYNSQDTAPIQLSEETAWKASSSETGAVQSLTLSYDGTALLSGHTGGAIVRWDVAKRRVVTEVANLQQPVSHVEMLTPDGLRHQRPNIIISTVTKPRLDLNAEPTDNSVGLPASYSITAQITHDPSHLHTSDPESEPDAGTAVLSGSLFPASMLDAALQSLATPATTTTTTHAPDPADTHRLQTLQDENALLQKQLAAMQKIHADSQTRHRKRQDARDRIARERRQAYVAARKKGGDGEKAMRPFQKKLDELDDLSDREELGADGGEDEGEMEVDG